MSTFNHEAGPGSAMIPPAKPSKVLFQLSGSIACFKACALISSLVKAGYEIEIAATRGALKFVGEATLEGLIGKRIHSDLYESGQAMSHIHLVRWADAIVLCPASANTLNKFAAGIADDLVSTLFLAHDFKKPYLVAPAMNQTMFTHPATRTALRTLASWGVTVLETGSGALACGEHGEGRMLEPHIIQLAIENALTPKIGSLSEDDAIKSTVEHVLKTRTAASHIDMTGLASNSTAGSPARQKKILITSGGSEEPIDGVRSITNTSTGRTGRDLATWFADHGDEVTLIHARSALRPEARKNISLKSFQSFASLDHVLKETLSSTHFDAVIHLAAVADYSLDEVEANGVTLKAPIASKLDSGERLTLRLKKNPKLVDSLRLYSKNPEIKVVAFKLTRTENIDERAEAIHSLAEHAHPNYIVHNDLDAITGSSHPFSVYEVGASDQVATDIPVAIINGAANLARSLSTLIDSNGALQ